MDFGGSGVCRTSRHGDGGGLYLVVKPGGGRAWVFMWKIAGKRREMGLGRWPDVSLSDARELADAARRQVAKGIDPIEHRREEAERRAAKPLGRPTFGEVADRYIATHEASWKSQKHAAQWRTTLGTDPYDASKVRIDPNAHAAHVAALSALRAKPVDEVETSDVLMVLAPIWKEAPETASRLRGRIEAVLDAATAQKLRSGLNPAMWMGNLKHLLTKRDTLTRGHHLAMPYQEVPAFVARLRACEGVSARALEFVILTAARSGEVFGAKWSEIDLEAKVWTVPAVRMKLGREHRVPLSGAALDLLRRVGSDHARDGYVFPGAREGAPLSVMATEMQLRRMGYGDLQKTTRVKGEVVKKTIEGTFKDYKTHGFRSSFRDWCGEETSTPRDVAEMALAHKVGSEVEIAYRRGDALEKRRKLMEAWASYCGTQNNARVIPLSRGRLRQG
jgi:integrase